MAEEQVERNPWTRGGFIAAAAVVAVLVVLGVVLTITGTRDDQPGTALPSTAASTPDDVTAPEPSASGDDADSSVCGLDGEKLEGTLAAAPTAEWQYQGTTAYPTSPEFGPGDVSAEGVRTCFQKSPEGALFMAANAFTQGSDPVTAASWARYAIAEGDNRAELIGDLETSSSADSRIDLLGYRLLAYDGSTARVDLAARTTADGTTVTVSGVYELVWQAGDWKISSDATEPLDVALIPDSAGYITWGA